MSSIMRARSAPTGRSEGWEVIGGSFLKPKVAGPSMLGIGCPDRHALPFITSPKRVDRHAPPPAPPPARAGSFHAAKLTFPDERQISRVGWKTDLRRCRQLLDPMFAFTW